MEKVILGRTNLEVTVGGLGCGGHSRLGLSKYGEAHAASIVRHAYELGVNFFDTSAAYGTESALGRGLEGIKRDSFVISSKFPYGGFEGHIAKPEKLTETLENCLRMLKSDYVDIYHLHAVTKEDYREATERFMPVMEKAKEQGKLRFYGITERFATDTSHEMLKIALGDNIFDVIMTGYNMLNPSAAKSILPMAMKNNTGVLNMFAVRSALSNPTVLKSNLERISDTGQGGDGFSADENIFAFLTESGAAESIVNAAYRFCRHSTGIHVTLTGTSNAVHLEENLRSIGMPALPEEILEKLETLFGNVDCVNAE